MMQYSSH